jgi:hypothetical protein
MTGIHDHVMYRKFGYGRGCAQISVDIRADRMTRAAALEWVRRHDGIFPWTYMGVSYRAVLDHIDMSGDEFFSIIDRFTNWELFSGEVDYRPILKEFA